METPAHRREDGGEAAPYGLVRAMLLVVVACAAAVAVVALHSSTGAGVRSPAEPRADELLGAADYNTISGKATIFWGEEDGMPGRYPPAYAAQLKKMRRLVKRVKLNNGRSKMVLKEEDTQIREIQREMEMTAEGTEERLMTNVDNFKPAIAQLETRAGPPVPQDCRASRARMASMAGAASMVTLGRLGAQASRASWVRRGLRAETECRGPWVRKATLGRRVPAVAWDLKAPTSSPVRAGCHLRQIHV